MTLDDFRLLIVRISLAAPLRPALVPVKLPRPVAVRSVGPRRPALRPRGPRPA